MGGKPRADPGYVNETPPPHFMHGCTFCHTETQRLVIGPRISICFDCVERARDHVGQIRLTPTDAKPPRSEG